jgi:hypothetical protein
MRIAAMARIGAIIDHLPLDARRTIAQHDDPGCMTALDTRATEEDY